MNDVVEREDLREGVFRQRRALLATSTVLLLYEAAGIRVSELSVLGTKVSIERPGLVPLALWALWIYFIIRYTQYFHDLRDRGFSATYNDRLLHLIQQVANRKFEREFRPPGVEPGNYLPPYFFDLNPMDLIKEGPEGWHVRASGGVHWRDASGSTHRQDFHNHRMVIGRRQLLVPRVSSFVYVMTRTRLATEYALPFLVALAPVVYLLYEWGTKR